MLPNFLGIGANRSGSTWIARNLGQHPDIYVPWKKELHFFDRHYEKGIEYYQEEFSGWAGESAIGEVTPEYLHNPRVALRIHKHLPNVRMIVSLRNPVERAYSAYLKLVATYALERRWTFEEKLQTQTQIVQVGFYYDHLVRYYELFPREQILVLVYEEMTRDPEAFLRKIYTFLKVDCGFVSPLINHKINSAASYKDLSRFKILWYLRRILGRLKLHGLANEIDKLNRRNLPQMQPKTREWLIEIYREKNKLLRDLIGDDLILWES